MKLCLKSFQNTLVSLFCCFKNNKFQRAYSDIVFIPLNLKIKYIYKIYTEVRGEGGVINYLILNY